MAVGIQTAFGNVVSVLGFGNVASVVEVLTFGNVASVFVDDFVFIADSLSESSSYGTSPPISAGVEVT